MDALRCPSGPQAATRIGRIELLLAGLLGWLAAPPAPAQPAAPAQSIAGTWDLYWATRRGPRQSGYLVIAQRGRDLDVEMHGRGEVRATGTLEGATFRVRGTRMLVPYTLEGRWRGDRLEGAFRVLGTELGFTGARRH